MHARFALLVLLGWTLTPACIEAREGRAGQDATEPAAPAPSYRGSGFVGVELVAQMPAGASDLCLAMRLVNGDGQTEWTKGALRRYGETGLGQPRCASGFGTGANHFMVLSCEAGDRPNRLTVWVTDVQFDGVTTASEERWTNPCPPLTEGSSLETADGGCELEVHCVKDSDVDVRFELDLRPGTPER